MGYMNISGEQDVLDTFFNRLVILCCVFVHNAILADLVLVEKIIILFCYFPAGHIFTVHLHILSIYMALNTAQNTLLYFQHTYLLDEPLYIPLNDRQPNLPPEWLT